MKTYKKVIMWQMEFSRTNNRNILARTSDVITPNSQLPHNGGNLKSHSARAFYIQYATINVHHAFNRIETQRLN